MTPGPQQIASIMLTCMIVINIVFMSVLWRGTREDIFRQILGIWLIGVACAVLQAPTFGMGAPMRVLGNVLFSAPFFLAQARLLARIRGFAFSWKRTFALVAAGGIGSMILFLLKVDPFWSAIPSSYAITYSILQNAVKGLFGKGSEPETQASRLLGVTVLLGGFHQVDFPFLYMIPGIHHIAFLISAVLLIALSIIAPACAVELVARENARLKIMANYGSQLYNAAKMSALGTMAGGVAHELNNPLAAMVLRIDLIREDLEHGNLQKMGTSIASLQELSARMTRIVKSLLTFAEGDKQTRLQSITAKSLVDSSLDLCRERVKRLGIELREGPVPDAQVVCHLADVTQILVELINNAADAVMPLKERWIAIEAEVTAESRISFKVTDSGSGIAPDIASRIMEPFFTTKAVSKGSGLGLSVALGIAESNKGRLFYDPTSPHTRFVLDLPASRSSP